MTQTLHATRARVVSRVCACAVALGALAFVLGLTLGRADVALASLDASWLFFAGLSTGSVALAAAVRVGGGRWASPVLPIAEAGERFFGAALGLLVALLAGACALGPWGASGPGRLANMALRQLVPTVVLFLLGRRFVSQSRGSHEDREKVLAAAVAYLLAYVVTLSLWAYDWILALSRSPPATVIPAYYFFGAFVAGCAWTALVAAVRRISGPDLRHDLGKLLFALIAAWTYLLWALFLATWYANIPEEVEPLLRRWHGVYKPITAGVLAMAFAWPFSLLFPERLKRRSDTLGLAAAMTLAGLWAERFLLVLPSLDLAGGTWSLFVGGGTAIGVAGLFLLTVCPHLAPRLAGDDATGAPPRAEEHGAGHRHGPIETSVMSATERSETCGSRT
ncbi:MAG TPA: hypothetical protein VN953_02270 [Gemmatimonadales bacterium]|nr:hypothetical protein [Gemmatimonadales bacterium]